MVGAGKEAIVFTARYGMQRGAKAGHTVGVGIQHVFHGRLEANSHVCCLLTALAEFFHTGGHIPTVYPSNDSANMLSDQ